MIYVVDDDEAVRESLCRLLDSFDWRVRAFDSAVQCLTAAQSERPACILADLKMPSMDALELQRALQRQGIHVPMIVVTVFHDSQMLKGTRPPGIVEVIEKPCDAEVLDAAIRKALTPAPAPGS